MKDTDRILCLSAVRYLAEGDMSPRQFGWNGGLSIGDIDYRAAFIAQFSERNGRITMDLTHPTPGHIETLRFYIIQRPNQLIVDTHVLGKGEEIPEIAPTHTHLRFKRTEPLFSPLSVGDITTPFPTTEDIQQRNATPEQVDLYHIWEIGDALEKRFLKAQKERDRSKF